MSKISMKEISEIISQFKNRDLISVVTMVCKQTYISESDLVTFALNKSILPDSVKFVCDYAEGMMFEIIQSRTTVLLDPLDLLLNTKYRFWLGNIIYKVLTYHAVNESISYDLLEELYKKAMEYMMEGD